MYTVNRLEISRCLHKNSFINVSEPEVLINYSQPRRAAAIPTHNKQHHSCNVCWIQIIWPSPGTELTVDWLSQTCTPANYVSVHQWHKTALPEEYWKSMEWKEIRWTGCEYKEDPISAHYITEVSNLFVGLHVRGTDEPYQVSLRVRAGLKLPRFESPVGGKDLVIKHVSPYSGNMCALMLIFVCLFVFSFVCLLICLLVGFVFVTLFFCSSVYCLFCFVLFCFALFVLCCVCL